MTDRLVQDCEHIIKFEDETTDYLNERMAQPDINGIDLSFYHVYKYVSKVNHTFLYVIENPDGEPFHHELNLDAWLYYLDILRMSLKCRTNLVDMAEEYLPKSDRSDDVHSADNDS